MTVTFDRDALRVEMARKCMNRQELIAMTGSAPSTVLRATQGRGVSTKTAGKIAKALNVDVTEIIKQD